MLYEKTLHQFSSSPLKPNESNWLILKVIGNTWEVISLVSHMYLSLFYRFTFLKKISLMSPHSLFDIPKGIVSSSKFLLAVTKLHYTTFSNFYLEVLLYTSALDFLFPIFKTFFSTNFLIQKSLRNQLLESYISTTMNNR